MDNSNTEKDDRSWLLPSRNVMDLKSITLSNQADIFAVDSPEVLKKARV